ncbi:hypothetical protein BVX98_04985 [bacterium F11]|nr:hypothetical protein BVX98_04985 [bacterium F11]
MLTSLLENQIVWYARQIELAGVGIFKFEEKIKDNLKKAPIQEWEADRWFRGIKLRLIRTEDYFYRVGRGKGSAFSLFVRNEKGLNVGLRREAITQMATYVSLITDYGYPRGQTQFESQWMDVVVYDKEKSTLIYAENKASSKTLEKLCLMLQSYFEENIPEIPETKEGNPRFRQDPIMKANHIWRNKPEYFWGVSPTLALAYCVRYNDMGFTMEKKDHIPLYMEIPAKDPIPY